jgi:tagatose-1,6-bisphosphate aldolase
MPKNEFHVQRISKQEMIEHLVLNQKLDSLYFIKYVTEYSSIFSESNFAAHWNRYKENLRLNLPENIPFYKVEVPQKYNERVFEKISRLVEKA